MTAKSPRTPGAPPQLIGPRTQAVLVTLLLLGLGLIPTAGGGAPRLALRSLHSLEPNRVDRAGEAGGYYVGLIDGPTAGRDELTLRLVGKPDTCVNFSQIGAARFLRTEFIQFELRPNLDIPIEETRFTTNALGERDIPYTQEKPDGVFRIVLLGASIDMGWGVDTQKTYENHFEQWLNRHAARRGLNRRFEVHNLAMAAYSPLHRLDSFVRKAEALQPDLVLLSMTRLDTRLLQIHLVSLIQDRIDLKYPFVRQIVQSCGLADSGSTASDSVAIEKDTVKARIEPRLWDVYEGVVADLAARCQARGLPLACLLVPRASEDDSPEYRSPDIKRLSSLASRQGLPVLDLSPSFDDEDPSAVEIAPWDDHPNALGHELIFETLGHRVVQNASVYRSLFGVDPLSDDPTQASAPARLHSNATPEIPPASPH